MNVSLEASREANPPAEAASACEYRVPRDVAIVLQIDLAGNITFVNDAAVEVSGFARAELIGSSHNIVRHPEMPRQVYGQMWSTVSQGWPWQGVLKNQRKDGCFYWLKVRVVPIQKDDATIGYTLLCEAADQGEIAAASAEHQRLASGARIRESRLGRLLTIRTGFRAAALFIALLLLAGGILGLGGLEKSTAAAGRLYAERLHPLGVAYELSSALNDLHAAFLQSGAPEALAGKLAAADAANAELARLTAPDVPHLLADEAAAVGTAYRLLNEALRAGAAEPPFGEMQQALRRLQQRIDALAAAEVGQLAQHNALIRSLAIFGIGGGILIVIFAGRLFLRDILQPLALAIRQLKRIAQGDLSGEPALLRYGETGELLAASVTMQAHLRVITEEIFITARAIHANCERLKGALFEISDHTEVQHDRLDEARRFLAFGFADDLKASLGELQAKIGALAASGDQECAIAELQEAHAKVANICLLQSFALDDFTQKIDAILDLIGKNRADTQEAYAMSEQLQATARRMHELAQYFVSPSQRL